MKLRAKYGLRLTTWLYHARRGGRSIVAGTFSASSRAYLRRHGQSGRCGAASRYSNHSRRRPNDACGCGVGIGRAAAHCAGHRQQRLSRYPPGEPGERRPADGRRAWRSWLRRDTGARRRPEGHEVRHRRVRRTVGGGGQGRGRAVLLRRPRSPGERPELSGAAGCGNRQGEPRRHRGGERRLGAGRDGVRGQSHELRHSRRLPQQPAVAQFPLGDPRPRAHGRAARQHRRLLDGAGAGGPRRRGLQQPLHRGAGARDARAGRLGGAHVQAGPHRG